MGKGLKLALIGLTVGFLLGLALRDLKLYLAGQLQELLDSEAKNSCACKFQSDPIDVSLLTLSAKVKNASLVSTLDGQPKLFFKKMRAKFSLSKIREHKIFLSRLDLLDGFSLGMSPQSDTYKFIAWLVAPVPPERDTPDRWKLKLLKLNLENFRFGEQFGSHKLEASQAKLWLERDELNNFRLKPDIGKLTLQAPAENGLAPNQFEIGRLQANLYLKDEAVEFDSLKLTRAESFFEAKLRTDMLANLKISGNANYRLDAKSLGLGPWINLGLQGQGQLDGSLEQPSFQSQFSSLAESPLALELTPDSSLIFDQLSGQLDFSLQASSPKLSINSLQAAGAASSLMQKQALVISSEAISGRFNLDIDRLNYNNIDLDKVNLAISLGGNLEQPTIQTSGSIASASLAGHSMKDLNLQAKYSDRAISFDLEQKYQDAQVLQARGQIDLSSKSLNPELSNLEIKTRALPLLDSPNGEASLWLNAEAQISGELSLEKLDGQASFNLSNSPLSSNTSFKGDAQLKNGLLSLLLTNPTQSFKTQTAINFLDSGRGTMTLDAKDFSISDLRPELECLTFDLHSDYKFELAKWREGKGRLNLDKFELGCDPYKTWISEPYQYAIENGILQIPSLLLNGPSTNLNLGGKISLDQGYDLKAKGSLNLHSVLPIVRRIDHLSGNVQLSANLDGPLSAPKFLGEAKVTDGEMGLESANLSVENLQGTVKLSTEQIKFETLNGNLNGGFFDLSGSVIPANLKQSGLNMKLEQIFLEPAEGTNLTLSGQLTLAQGEQQRPVIGGKIRIEHGELQREVDLVTILRTLVEYIFSIKQAQRELRSLPDIDLDIKASAPGNLFIFTNWLGAELKSNLKIGGTLSNPQIRGKLETLSGWFGFKDRRFDINSGVISFKPELEEPQLSLLSETYFVSPSADNLMIILEANGPLTNPRIELASDSGLSQREILNLLTSGQTALNEVGFDRLDPGVKLGAIPLLQDDEQYLLGRFFSRLTSIDSISLEPAYNPQRGVIDPTIVAIKHLSDELYLRGESFFSGNANESKLSLFYFLTPKLSLSGIIDAVSQEENTALGFDLTYTALSKQTRNLEIAVHGEHVFERSEILQRLRISEMSVIEPQQIDKIKQVVSEMYKEQGYFNSQIDVECEARSGYCKKLQIAINEGQKSKIQQIVFEGDALPDNISIENYSIASGIKNAGAKLLADIQADLLRKLRSEGYISARVSGSYKDIEEIPFRKLLTVKVHLGKPVSFVFSGNKAFSDEELLATINLFGRKQPFGNNTINLLVQNIERKYREAGYLFVAITQERLNDIDSERINYRINIQEEAKVKVDKVILSSESNLSEKHLRNLIEKYNPESYSDIFEPDFAIAEKLDTNVAIMREALVEDGYPQAHVSYLISPEENNLIIQYVVNCGEKVNAKKVEVRNWPEGATLPNSPIGEVSVPEANRYLNILIDALIESGYLNPQISQDFNAESELLYNVEAGVRTRISRIKINGNSSVKKSLILKRLQIKKGQAWSAEELYRAKTKLLKLGLFSRVDIRPLDGRLNEQEEGLLVHVQEKPLTTLEIGSGLNSEYGLHLFGEASDRELFTDGRSLALRLDTYYDSAAADISQGVASLKYVDPYILDSDFALTEDFRFQKLDLSSQEFNLDRVSLGSQLYRVWRDGSSVSLAHTILQEDLSDVSEGAALGPLDTGVLNLSMLSAAFGFDRRDNPLNPRRGYTLFFNSQVALKELGSDAGYYTLGSRFSLLYPLPLLSKRLSLAQNIHWQSAWTFEDTTNIPISQRFYLGGRNTVRGFRENSLGPRGADGSVIGGDVSALANFELRYLVAEAAALHAFFDAGNVFLRNQDPEYDDLRLSAGIGVRYLSPIGPIGLDLGHPLDERSGEPSVRVHFNIGTNF